MTADEMANDGYYVVAGIACHKYRKSWKFFTLWDGYGLSEATWYPMSAFIHRDGSIDPIFRSYLGENNDSPRVRRKANLLVPIYLLCLTELRRLQASRGGDIPQTSPPSAGSLFQATPAGVSAPPGGALPPHGGKQPWGSSEHQQPNSW